MENLSAERMEMVQTFMAVAGMEDPEFARDFLTDNGWQLEPSINAYMLMTGDDGVAHGSDGRTSPAMSALAGSAVPVPAPAMPPAAAEPAPPVVQRLVDDIPGVEGPAYETFRNFAAEGMQVAQSAAVPPAKDDYLFPPPADIMFHGNFEALRKAAEDEEKYCLVNIQKREEFSSQMLNRDTWPDDNVRAIMGFRFLFWQQEYESVGGTQYLSCYPASTLPVVDIIDPITGGLLERIEQYQSAEQMVERLTRFMDSHQWGKMGKTVIPTQSNFHMPQRQLHSMAGMASGPSAVSSGGGGGNWDVASRMSLENEDDALNAAIAASLQDGPLPVMPPGGCVDEDSQRSRSDSVNASHYSDSLRVMQEMEYQEALEQDRRKEMAAEQDRKRLKAEEDALRQREEEERLKLQSLRNALPPEPAQGVPGVVMLRMRFPGGDNHTRRFLETHKFKVVQDFMMINGADPALHTVATTFPRTLISDPNKDLKELGLAPQMALVVERK